MDCLAIAGYSTLDLPRRAPPSGLPYRACPPLPASVPSRFPSLAQRTNHAYKSGPPVRATPQGRARCVRKGGIRLGIATPCLYLTPCLPVCLSVRPSVSLLRTQSASWDRNSRGTQHGGKGPLPGRAAARRHAPAGQGLLEGGPRPLPVGGRHHARHGPRLGFTGRTVSVTVQQTLGNSSSFYGLLKPSVRTASGSPVCGTWSVYTPPSNVR